MNMIPAWLYTFFLIFFFTVYVASTANARSHGEGQYGEASAKCHMKININWLCMQLNID